MVRAATLDSVFGLTVGLNWPEIVLGAAFLLLVANAARRGFLREASLLVGLGGALWLAGSLFRRLSPQLPPEVGSAPWPTVVYVVLTLVLVLVAAGLSAHAAPALRRGSLRLLDRALGGAVGVVEAAILVGLLAMVGERLGAPRLAAEGPAARVVEAAGAALLWLRAAVPPEVLPTRLL